MELKVIRSFGNAASGAPASSVSRTANIEAVVKGVKQAGSYRVNRAAEEGLLEIYDLRKNKTEDLREGAEVRDAMRNFSPPIGIRVWPLFGSSEDARAAGYTGV